MFETTEFWMIITAIIFTGVGFIMGLNFKSKGVVEQTIDLLIEQGYIKTRKNRDGELEILKHDEK